MRDARIITRAIGLAADRLIGTFGIPSQRWHRLGFGRIHPSWQPQPFGQLTSAETPLDDSWTRAQLTIFQSVDAEPNETASARVAPSISQR